MNIFAKMNTEREIPHIAISETQDLKQVKIYILEESEEVDMGDFNTCMRELQITSIAMLRFRFAEVCDWFIRQKQYVPFEMIQNA